jgi:hypothetical protein
VPVMGLGSGVGSGLGGTEGIKGKVLNMVSPTTDFVSKLDKIVDIRNSNGNLEKGLEVIDGEGEEGGGGGGGEGKRRRKGKGKGKKRGNKEKVVQPELQPEVN